VECKLKKSIKLSRKISRHLGIYTIFIILAVSLISGVLGYSFANPTSTTILEEGSLTSTAGFVIWEDSSYYYSRSGVTGEVAYTGSNAYTVISSSISSLPNDKGKILFKSGDYELNTAVVVPENVTLEGEDKTGVKILLENNRGFICTSFGTVKNFYFEGDLNDAYTDQVAITINGSDSDALYTRISGITLDGTYDGIEFIGVLYNCWIDHIQLISCVNHYITTDDTSSPKIAVDISHVFGNSVQAKRGIYLYGLLAVTIDSCDIAGVFTEPVLYLEKYEGGIHLVSNSAFENTEQNAESMVAFGVSDGDRLRFLFFSNCYFNGVNATDGAVSESVVWMKFVEKSRFTTCDFSGNQSGALSMLNLTQCHKIDFTACDFENTATSIRFASCTNMLINGGISGCTASAFVDLGASYNIRLLGVHIPDDTVGSSLPLNTTLMIGITSDQTTYGRRYLSTAGESSGNDIHNTRGINAVYYLTFNGGGGGGNVKVQLGSSPLFYGMIIDHYAQTGINQKVTFIVPSGWYYRYDFTGTAGQMNLWALENW